MPQLDRLAFSSQIFWLFLLFFVSYYFFLQICVLRLKFNLGLKRFIFQVDKFNNFYNLTKYYYSNDHTVSRSDLLFFFESYNFSFKGTNEQAKDSSFLRTLLFDVSNNSILRPLFSIGIVSGLFELIVSILDNFFSLLGLNKKNEQEYSFILTFNKDYYSFLYEICNKSLEIEFKDLNIFTKEISLFYEKFFMYISYFFKMVKFYVFEVIFTLFFYFFNIFFKIRKILFYFKVLRNSIIKLN